jgi:CRISPR-associated protein Csm3
MADEIKHIYIPLYGRVVIRGKIEAETGIRIGGNPSGIEIGGIDNIVLRNPVSQLPYIPGSSLKGKMRSLYERYSNRPINHQIDQVRIHSCHKDKTDANYQQCNVCHIYGLPAEGETKAAHPTPLIVRDVGLTAIGDQNVDELDEYTEVKWEAAIDRITSAAVPRQMERVPAGAVFEPMELIYNVYSADVRERLPQVFVALQLVEDDYLGGLGSRGSGKVRFVELKVTCKRDENGRYKTVATKQYADLEALLSDETFEQWVAQQIPTEE